MVGTINDLSGKTSSNWVLYGGAALIGALAVAGFAVYQQIGRVPSGAALAACGARAFDEIGGPIDLIDETGAAVTQASFADKPTLVYFGFTQCPDVCPLTLQTLGEAYRLGPFSADDFNSVLISLDPERDTPAALAPYVASNGFPPGLKGLTGAPDAIDAAAKAFKIYHQRVDTPDSAAAYSIDHSSILYVMDRNWKLLTFFPDSEEPQAIANCLRHIVDKAQA